MLDFGCLMKDMIEKIFISKSLEETVSYGSRLGEKLAPDTVLAFTGELGSGKTTLIQGICRGLSVADEVTSPTFVLIREYRGRLEVYHFDAYRLDGPAALREIGCEEYFERGGVSLVEWADRVAEIIPEGATWIDLQYVPEEPGSRRITVREAGEGLA